MPFAAEQMDPEMTILSEVSQTEKDKCRHLYVILTYDTDELTYETNRLTENRIMVANGVGVWKEQMQSIVYGMDKQQGPTV